VNEVVNNFIISYIIFARINFLKYKWWK